LRDAEGYRLFDRREELMKELLDAVRKDKKRIEREIAYPLARTAATNAHESNAAPRRNSKSSDKHARNARSGRAPSKTPNDKTGAQK